MARSRHTTPSAPASTAPAGRARRSRSRTHDAVPAPAATQPAPATTRKSTRAKSVESNVSAVSRASKSRRRVDGPQEIKVDLTNIQEDEEEDEDSEVEEPDFDIPPPDDVPKLPQQDNEDEEAGAAVGDMSGTTALDQQSEDEEYSQDRPIDKYDLLAHAPAAYRAALAVIEHFDPKSSDTSDFEEKIDALRDALAQLSNGFKRGVLSPDVVIDALFESKPGKTSKSWLVKELVNLLNIAVIFRHIVTREPNDSVELLDQLDAQFPLPFLEDLYMENDKQYRVGFSSLQEQTFDVALATRLQSAVLKIKESYALGESSDDVMQDTFFASKDRQTLRAWQDINGLGGGDTGLLPEYNALMRKWIKRLDIAIQQGYEDIDDGSKTELELAGEKFTWSYFQDTFVNWSKQRAHEIVRTMYDNGGIKGLLEAARTEFEKDEDFNPDAVIDVPRSPVKAQRKNASARPTARQQSITSSPPATASSQHHNFDQSDEPVQPLPDLEPHAMDVVSQLNEKQRQQKENIRGQPAGTNSSSRPRFIDAQPDAEKITDFNTQASQSQRQFRHPPSLSNRSPGKRKQTHDEVEDVTDAEADDDEFEDDNREVDMSQRRREAHRVQPSPKRVRIEQPVPSSSNQQRPQGTAPARSTSTQRGSQDPRVQEYAEQKRIMSSQAARTVATKRQNYPQGRTRWDEASEMKLEEYVSEIGCSWAQIKKTDEDSGDALFEGRDQVALKDKARNMKANMILAGVDPLPRNWDLVPLDKKGVDRCLRAGVSQDALIRAGVKV